MTYSFNPEKITLYCRKSYGKDVRKVKERKEVYRSLVLFIP
jgi:hypothetical protein